MREIKFRAWDKDKKVMYRVRNILWINQHISSVMLENGEGLKRLDDIVLMQYTGLKDSNGVEIYEGDIIRGMDMLSARTGGRVDDREVVGQVVIDSSSVWGFSIVVYETEYHLNDFLENDQEAEVIGNIYENTELLED